MRARPKCPLHLFFAAALLIAGAALAPAGLRAATTSVTPAVAVGPQYDSTHVYATPEDFDRFVTSVIATFGGTTSTQSVTTVTPTPSRTRSQLVLTPAGSISVFGYETPVPYPFGAERNGYLVSDLGKGVSSAATDGADVVVAPFDDPIGKDAIIQWPGGVDMQLYWHTVAPNYAALTSVPENRIYVSTSKADEFIRDSLAFSHGTVVEDVARAPGTDIGRPNDIYRRVRITSSFGKVIVYVTNGFLPFPFGREVTGYEVPDLSATLRRAKLAGVDVISGPSLAEGRQAAVVRFPGGYIAEIHSAK